MFFYVTILNLLPLNNLNSDIKIEAPHPREGTVSINLGKISGTYINKTSLRETNHFHK